MSKMLDPKYANLPGIAHDQPDSYETEDLPESDQYVDFNEEESNANIERPNISIEAAYERFRLQTIGVHGVNFDDNHGYTSSGYAGEDDVKETPAVKLARLKSEIEELKKELKENPPKGKEEQVDLKELLSLEKELESISHRNVQISNQAVKDKLAGAKESGPSQGKKGASVGSSLNPTQKVTELEARLQKLESVLGTSTQPLGIIGLQPKNSTVLGAITVLHSKLSLLEPSHIELLEAKLSSVLQKVTKISEKKLDVQELERTLKLSSLYDLLESSSSTLEALPDITRRLDSLRDLHKKASEVVQDLNEVKSIQNSIRVGTTDNEKQLKELQAALESYIGKM